MDGCAAHVSVAIYTGREKADVDSHTRIYDAYTHSGHCEVLLRVSSQNHNRKPLKGCLTRHAEAQVAETTPEQADTRTSL